MFICSIVMLRLLELGTGSRCDFNVAGCCWSSSCSWITFNETLFYDSCLIVVRLCPYMMISSTAGCSTLARLSVFGSISAGPSGPHCHLEHRFISAAPPCLHPHTFTSARHAAAGILMLISPDRKTLRRSEFLWRFWRFWGPVGPRLWADLLKSEMN